MSATPAVLVYDLFILHRRRDERIITVRFDWRSRYSAAALKARVQGSNPGGVGWIAVLGKLHNGPCLSRLSCINEHKVFLRYPPVYGGTTSATIRWCNGASPEVFRKKHLFPERGYYNNNYDVLEEATTATHVYDEPAMYSM